jgi:hypothetical protein
VILLDITPPHLYLLPANPADNYDMMDDMADYSARHLDAVDLAIEADEERLRAATYHAGLTC